MMNIAVVGAGYVGLVTSACLAHMGHQVTCIEIDEAKVAALQDGRLPIYEPGLAQLWRRHAEQGHLKATGSYVEGLQDAQMVFISVGTPAQANGQADTRFVMDAVRRVTNHCRGTPVLCIKSTVPVGTGKLVAQLASEASPSGHWPVVSNPEFLREGHAIADFLEPDRVVVGSADPEAACQVGELYAPLGKPILYTDNATAELIKYACNAFLATKISFINEIAQLADMVGVNIQKVTEGMYLDHRIAATYLEAGLGWGGSCFPKDAMALLRLMESHHLPGSLLRSAVQVNDGQIEWAVRRLAALVGPLQGATIAVWGLAFKPETDDVRCSPALSLIEALLRQGCQIRAYDPEVPSLPVSVGALVTVCHDAYAAAQDADALVIATGWPQFRALDLARVRRSMANPVLLDARNLLDQGEAEALGFRYSGIGRPSGAALPAAGPTGPQPTGNRPAVPGRWPIAPKAMDLLATAYLAFLPLGVVGGYSWAV